MGMSSPVYYTADMVRALPDDGKRYETVYGELLVTPAPRLWHQEIVKRLLVMLESYLQREGVGHVLASPADISWGPDNLVQPDIFVASTAEVRTLDWSQVQTLLLAVEVVSPTTARHDRFTKRRLYQEVGIPEYWVVDPDAETVEVWSPEATFPTTSTGRVEWRPTGAASPFTVDLKTLFRPIA